MRAGFIVQRVLMNRGQRVTDLRNLAIRCGPASTGA